MAGLCEGNEATVKQALALDKSKQTQAIAVLACGDLRQRQVGVAVGAGVEQEVSRRHAHPGLFQPLAKAFVALAAGQAQEAVDAAEPAKSWDAIYPGSYVQGLAYLQLHDAGRALSAFQARNEGPRRQSGRRRRSTRKRNWA